MKLAGRRGYGRERAGVLDAGILLVRLDGGRRGHADAVRLLEAGRTGAIRLLISAVNLAEALEHARPHALASGVDLVAILKALGVAVHAPDTVIARRVAGLADVHDLSLADRFALATALELEARLFTTDAVLVDAARAARLATTRI